MTVGRFAEATVTAILGGALAAPLGKRLGCRGPAVAVAAVNGALSGWRGIYSPDRRGALAFTLDSTWGLFTTTAALAAHAVGLRGGNAQYQPELSARQNRHVYGRGLQLRAGFATTYGNTICGVGDTSIPRRARLVTDHEDVHVWQSRWFGPLFPLLYDGWMVIGGAIGLVVWLAGRFQAGRHAGVGQTVESFAYYMNPFEWWAYSRDANWPPSGVVKQYAPTRPLVKSFAAHRLR